MDLKEKVRALPDSAGVYLMKGDDGTVLYVGKADNLKKRVSSYFQKGRYLSEKTKILISKVVDITFIPASSGAEALIYENSLIKQLSPRYNVALRDDKSYPFLKLTMNEDFPRLLITRQKKPDGAVYYGPYTNVKLLREALVILRHMFPLRTCVRMQKRPCLDYHIKQCAAPCTDMIDKEHYKAIVAELRLFLEGRRTELVKLLSEKMAAAAGSENFEEAALLRNRIETLSAIRENRVTYNPSGETEELKDIIGIKGALDRIEAFDVSNMMGKEAVGSMVSFYKGRPDKNEYRRFKIKTVFKIDDYGMMRELIKRRYARVVEEKRKLPDLILIDGGKGHLAAATEELGKLGIDGVPAIGIAKEREHLYLKEKKEPLILPRESKALHLLQRIRDEAHRFAIAYHKHLLSKNIKVSELDNISGIGRKRRKALMRRFDSLDEIRSARLEDLLKVEGMNEKTAKNIIDYFKK
ncbi:MAG: excinuclease ABC subunit UvrC [Candidatus Omnitrophica bacterium]|nr:excinuclease ABC subunit UvrC [Candidatus Omnitrophota bacterium]